MSIKHFEREMERIIAERRPRPARGPVSSLDVRCPHCDKKLGDYLAGVYRTTCPRCHREVTITR